MIFTCLHFGHLVGDMTRESIPIQLIVTITLCLANDLLANISLKLTLYLLVTYLFLFRRLHGLFDKYPNTSLIRFDQSHEMATYLRI